jgi:hypothetical protein
MLKRLIELDQIVLQKTENGAPSNGEENKNGNDTKTEDEDSDDDLVMMDEPIEVDSPSPR